MNLVKNIITGDLSRLRYIDRYSSVMVLHKETVAEHMYYVSLYAYLIGLTLNEEAHLIRCEQLIPSRVGVGSPIGTINMEKLLRFAISHDLEEARTGDINRMFKHSSTEVSEAIDKAAHNEMYEMTIGLKLLTGVSAEITDDWSHSKDKSYEGRIVSFCDYLSVLSYMLQELSCSNTTMLQHHATMMKYVTKFGGPEYDFIRVLVNEAVQLTMDNLGNESPIRKH